MRGEAPGALDNDAWREHRRLTLPDQIRLLRDEASIKLPTPPPPGPPVGQVSEFPRCFKALGAVLAAAPAWHS